ncbi:unnamed protein product [Symbiodinium sp. KB8]|nr:unnamed protein product [Symbiodinium sp. KB8]
MGHSLQSWATDLSSPGAMPSLVSTAVRYRISCEMCSRSKRPMGHSLQSWVMDLLSPGAMPTVVATAVRYRSSCEMCRRSKLHLAHSLQFWLMDLWSPGAMPSMVATAVRYRTSCAKCSRSKISCEMCSRSRRPMGHSLQSWAMDLSSPGATPSLQTIAVPCSISCVSCRASPKTRRRTSCEVRSRWSTKRATASPSFGPGCPRCWGSSDGSSRCRPTTPTWCR